MRIPRASAQRVYLIRVRVAEAATLFDRLEKCGMRNEPHLLMHLAEAHSNLGDFPTAADTFARVRSWPRPPSHACAPSR